MNINNSNVVFRNQALSNKATVSNLTTRTSSISGNFITSDSFERTGNLTFTSRDKTTRRPGKLISLIDKIKSGIKGNIIVISGPSGVGKDTVIDRIRELDPEINLTVPYTTRPPRPGEKEGVNFYYITKDKFEKLIEEGNIFEYAYFNNNYYGSSIEEIESKRNGHDVILNLTADQAVKVKEKFKDKAFLVFIDPPSIEELEQRLRGRGTETEESIKNRLDDASYQMSFSDKFDLKVVNETGKLEEAVTFVSTHINSQKKFLFVLMDKIKRLCEKITF
ncbi:MAG: guanylate kinase [Cyanobacteriota bacterium]